MISDRFEIILDRLTAALVNLMQENAELKKTNELLVVRLNRINQKGEGNDDK